ncbi:MAG TPA: ComEA family DNA-binding protein [Longimicrobium sp.]|nr:ComEA family DNA-binding protein [Longimicrobium sp.]
MNTTPQERTALGVFALLVSLGVGARMLNRPDAVELTGAAPSEDSAAFRQLEQGVETRTADAARRAAPLAAGERIDPNTAAESELDRLPKVGPGQARRIVAWRQAHGPFRTLADLDSVPGIGPAALAAVAPFVTLPPAPAGSERGAHPESATAREGANSPPRAAGPVDAVEGGRRVNLNSASADELQTLPGIGPALAARIVAHRAANGPFRSVEELQEVPGIGPATATRLKGRVDTSP